MPGLCTSIHLLFNRLSICDRRYGWNDANDLGVVVILVLSLVAAVASLGGRDAAPAKLPVEMAQITIEQRVIMRVPMARPGSPRHRAIDRIFGAPEGDVEWEEHKGPKCVSLRMLRGALVTSGRGVDLVLRDNTRLRARLGRECRSADLYSGFYIQPHADGTLCADRDELLARSGMNCPIKDFKRLVPDKP
jgi:hypothetical protein